MISRNELKVGDVVRFKLNFDHDRRTHIYTSVFDLFVERGVEWTITHIKAGTWHVTGNGVELVIEGHWFSEVQVPDEDVFARLMDKNKKQLSMLDLLRDYFKDRT
jgi:hypothetical protein